MSPLFRLFAGGLLALILAAAPAHAQRARGASGWGPGITGQVVFGVKESLIAQFDKHAAGKAPDGTQVDVPFYTCNYDFRLRPAV